MSINSADPARGVRRLLVALLVLALAAAGGAFVLSQRGGSGARARVTTRPSLFPTRFSQSGFLTGQATLVKSYDTDAGSRRLSATVTSRETAYVVAVCQAGTVHVAIGGLTSNQACTGRPVGVVAVNLIRPTRLTATVNASQPDDWGVAIYRRVAG